MKKIIILIFGLLLTTTSVFATEYSNQLPLGKNYLDYNNYTNQVGELNSIDTIKVLPNTNYVISVPGETNLPNMEIYISGVKNYVYGDVSDLSNCVESSTRTYCTFKTASNETGVDVDFYAYHMDYYYENNGISGFQLETGTSPTAYASYMSPGEDATPPVISGQGAYYTDYDAPESLSLIVANHFSAYDVIDGDLSSQIEVTSDGYSGHESILGYYPVRLEVKDFSNNLTIYDFTIVVGDRRDPVITGPDTLYLDISDAVSVNHIIEDSFTIIDEYDGELTNFTIVNDEYSTHIGTPGTYGVSFRAKDQSGNTAYHTFDIIIQDLDAPVYSGDLEITSNLSNPIFTEDIMSTLEFSDNYSSNTDVSTEIITNELLHNELVVGRYLLEVRLTDEQNNTTRVEIYVDVQDDVFPEFIGPVSIERSYSMPLSIDDIISLYTVQDNYNSLDQTDITVSNENYIINSSVIGLYNVELEVSDEAGNNTVHRLTINVIDDVPPIISGDDFIVTLNTRMNFNENDAVLLLINNGSLPNQDYKVTTLINEYVGNEDVPGQYLYSLLLDGEDGTQYEKDFLIQVQEETVQEEPTLIRNIAVYSIALGLIGIYLYKQIRK